MKKIIRVLEEIFFLPSASESVAPEVISRDDTKHYTSELETLYLDGVFIATSYESSKSLLERYKYHSDREVSSLLVPLLLESLDNVWVSQDIDAIVPVPMHWSRYFLRGYNHIWLLAKGLSHKTKIPYLPALVAPLRLRQAKLSKSERKEKKFGNFTRKSKIHIPKTVLLIDDVISTGSTANACAKVLKDGWAETVYGLFLASNRNTHVWKNPNHPRGNT